MVRVSLDLGTRRTTSHLEARVGQIPGSRGGYLANPLVASTGPQPEPDFNNVIELVGSSPLRGRYLLLVRTGSEDPDDLQLRVDEVYTYWCPEINAGVIAMSQ